MIRQFEGLPLVKRNSDRHSLAEIGRDMCSPFGQNTPAFDKIMGDLKKDFFAAAACVPTIRITNSVIGWMKVFHR